VVPSSDSVETRVAHQMPGPPALRITSWSARPTGDDQLSIFGTVQNVGGRVAAAVDIAVTLFDSEGERIGSAEAVVSSTALMPNVQVDFEARFDDSPNFAEVQFVAKTTEIELSRPANSGELDEPVGDEPHATGRTEARAKPRS
jgi:alanine-alpha-ketoisovalerate/valine-pyruvate aminotransferase